MVYLKESGGKKVIQFFSKREGKLVNINEVDIEKPRFMLKILPIIKNGEQREYLYIVHKDKCGNKINSPFSNYFFDKVLGKSMKNLSLNTKKNFHGRFIVMFLNYVFYDGEDVVTCIEDLKIEHIQGFLEKYSCGEIGRSKDRKWKSANTALDAGDAISKFCYWIITAKDKNRINSFKMKYIKKSDFDIAVYYKKNKYNDKTEEVRRVDRICDFEVSKASHERKKVTRANLYIVKSLVEVARANDPMMVFPVVLGAFVGLRQGEVTQMHRGRIVSFKPYDVLKDCYINLLSESMLREDGKYTGNIKVKRKQPVYPVFLPVIDSVYRQHLKLLQSSNNDTHIHSALLIDNNGKAMTYSTYHRRFQELVEKLKMSLLELSEIDGDENAMFAYEILTEPDTCLTHHSLRHFYTHQIDNLEKNLIVTQYYRGDSSVSSQNDYKGNMASVEGIKMVQQWFYDELKNFGWGNI